MANISRPISPHLTIYRPQATSVLSILHRITGSVLAVFVPVLIIFVKYVSLSASVYSVYSFNFFINNSIEWLVLSALFALTFSLYYHMGNGFRHLLWDNAKVLDIEDIYASGNILILSSLFCTIITWLLLA